MGRARTAPGPGTSRIRARPRHWPHTAHTQATRPRGRGALRAPRRPARRAAPHLIWEHFALWCFCLEHFGALWSTSRTCTLAAFAFWRERRRRCVGTEVRAPRSERRFKEQNQNRETHRATAETSAVTPRATRSGPPARPAMFGSATQAEPTRVARRDTAAAGRADSAPPHTRSWQVTVCRVGRAPVRALFRSASVNLSSLRISPARLPHPT